MARHSRRRFLSGLAIGGSMVAVGAGGMAAMTARAAASYEEAVAATWRHSETRELPWPAAQRELVRYATLAASSHNTQPWRFKLADDGILLLPDRDRRLPAVDPDDHHLFASLGCAAENVVQAAGAFRLRATPSYDPASGGLLLLLEDAKAEETELFDAIPRRQSTRADYDGRPVPPDHLAALEAAGNGEGVRLLLTEPAQREQILQYLIAANSAQMDDPAVVAELRSWMRFSYGEALAARGGLFAKASGNPVLPGWIGRVFFGMFFTKDAENRKYEGQLRSSAGLAVVVADRNEPAGWIEAGRCCQRFALQATALGLRYSFVNQPVEVAAVRGQLAAYLGIGERRPDLLLRFGYGPPMPRSLRRPVGAVLG
jgi:Nitroreductase family